MNEIKSIGIVRKFDELGRVVIPKELRTSLGIKKNQLIKFHIQNGDTIALEIIEEIGKSNFGISRELDDLGRIVIPKETRDMLDIKEKTPVEFFTDNESVFLKKYVPGCIFCGSYEIAKIHKGKNICKKCLSTIIRN